MKLSFAPLLVLVFTLFTCISASPVLSNKDIIEESLINTHALVARTPKFPVKSNDVLIAKIMTNVKANLHAKVWASVSATFCERVSASLNIQASAVGGLIKIGKVQIKTIQSAAIKKVKAKFEASLDAQVQAKIYAVLEAKLRKKCGTSVLDKATLIRILTELEAEAKVLIKAELPKIGADLKLKIKEEVQACVKDVEVHIPLVTKIKIDADFNAKVTLDACVAVGLKMCAKLNAKALAKLVLAKL